MVEAAVDSSATISMNRNHAAFAALHFLLVRNLANLCGLIARQRLPFSLPRDAHFLFHSAREINAGSNRAVDSGHRAAAARVAASGAAALGPAGQYIQSQRVDTIRYRGTLPNTAARRIKHWHHKQDEHGHGGRGASRAGAGPGQWTGPPGRAHITRVLQTAAPSWPGATTNLDGTTTTTTLTPTRAVRRAARRAAGRRRR